LKTDAYRVTSALRTQLRQIRHLNRNLIPANVSRHGTHALLAGSYHGLRAGAYDFLDLALGDFGGEPGVEHFQIAAAAAALAILAIARQFHQPHARNGLNHLARGVEHARAPAQVAGIVVSDCEGSFLHRHAPLPYQIQQVLRRVRNLHLPRIVLAPHLVTRRAGKHHFPGALGPSRLHVVLGKFLELVLQPRAQQGKSAAPLVRAQEREIHFASRHDFGERGGDFLRHREVGRHTPGEVHHLGLVLHQAVVGRIAHVLHPIGALFVILGEHVPVGGEVLADHVDLGGIGTGMHHVRPHRQPQVLEADGHYRVKRRQT
jgi:hypothetical protein